jgi:hypothetical protein
VAKYAEDKKAYHENLGRALIKASLLGQEGVPLTDIVDFLDDHPDEKIDPCYY